MTQEQTQQYVNVTLTFLKRATITGEESEVMSEVKRWLASMVQPIPQPPIEDKKKKDTKVNG